MTTKRIRAKRKKENAKRAAAVLEAGPAPTFNPASTINVADIPPAGEERREWLRFELRRVRGPDGKRYTQAHVARFAGASEGTVSLVYLGARIEGAKADTVRAITANILGVPVGVLFPAPLGKLDPAEVDPASTATGQSRLDHRDDYNKSIGRALPAPATDEPPPRAVDEGA